MTEYMQQACRHLEDSIEAGVFNKHDSLAIKALIRAAKEMYEMKSLNRYIMGTFYGRFGLRVERENMAFPKLPPFRSADPDDIKNILRAFCLESGAREPADPDNIKNIGKIVHYYQSTIPGAKLHPYPAIIVRDYNDKQQRCDLFIIGPDQYYMRDVTHSPEPRASCFSWPKEK